MNRTLVHAVGLPAVLLNHIEIRDLRNIAGASVFPSRRSTVIVGPNGHGKTNLLEAIYLLATLRPLRAGRFAELIRFGAEEAAVSGEFEVAGGTRRFGVRVREGGRNASVDGKAVRSLDEYFGGVSVVAFTPDDLTAIKGGPEARRRLVDRAAFNRFPAYLGESRDYQRALRARNRLLRNGAPPAELDAFTVPLARHGARLVVRRLVTLKELSPRLAEAWAAIAPDEPPVTLRYLCLHMRADVQTEVDIAEALLVELGRRTARDVERGFTTVGPHVDDLAFEFAERSARTYASQGQQRALVIGFKIAEIENLRETIGRPPILLLDDVSSELDPERNAFLMRYLARAGTQVLLTTTDPRLVAAATGPDARYLAVNRGEIAETERP